MKKTKWLGVLALAGLLETGCSRTTTDTPGATNAVAIAENSMSASNAWQNAKQDASNAWNATASGASNAWQTAKETGTNAWQATGKIWQAATNEVSTNYFAYNYSQKDAFLTDAQGQMAWLDGRINDFSRRLTTTGNNNKPDLQGQLQDIKTRRADLDTKYQGVQRATSDSWNDAKGAYIKSFLDLRASLKAGEDLLKVS